MSSEQQPQQQQNEIPERKEEIPEDTAVPEQHVRRRKMTLKKGKLAPADKEQDQIPERKEEEEIPEQHEDEEIPERKEEIPEPPKPLEPELERSKSPRHEEDDEPDILPEENEEDALEFAREVVEDRRNRMLKRQDEITAEATGHKNWRPVITEKLSQGRKLCAAIRDMDPPSISEANKLNLDHQNLVDAIRKALKTKPKVTGSKQQKHRELMIQWRAAAEWYSTKTDGLFKEVSPDVQEGTQKNLETAQNLAEKIAYENGNVQRCTRYKKMKSKWESVKFPTVFDDFVTQLNVIRTAAGKPLIDDFEDRPEEPEVEEEDDDEDVPEAPSQSTSVPQRYHSVVLPLLEQMKKDKDERSEGYKLKLQLLGAALADQYLAEHSQLILEVARTFDSYIYDRSGRPQKRF